MYTIIQPAMNTHAFYHTNMHEYIYYHTHLHTYDITHTLTCKQVGRQEGRQKERMFIEIIQGYLSQKSHDIRDVRAVLTTAHQCLVIAVVIHLIRC